MYNCVCSLLCSVGGLPIILAALLVHPHPLTFYVYVFFRLCDNVVNHSGEFVCYL
jgi:hypothetical protein